jgi:hypothetical protein
LSANSLGPTFFRETKPIDEVWATNDLTIMHACVMKAGYGVGDHQMFVIDFHDASLVGTSPFKIKPFVLHRLNTKVFKEARRKYLAILEENLRRH